MNRIIGMFSKWIGHEELEVECLVCHQKLWIEEKDKGKEVYCFGCNLKEIVEDDLRNKLHQNSALASHIILLENGFEVNPMYSGSLSDSQPRYIYTKY